MKPFLFSILCGEGKLACAGVTIFLSERHPRSQSLKEHPRELLRGTEACCCNWSLEREHKLRLWGHAGPATHSSYVLFCFDAGAHVSQDTQGSLMYPRMTLNI